MIDELRDRLNERGISLTCIQCGTCTVSCASVRYSTLNTRKLVSDILEGNDSLLGEKEVWYCTTCYRCQERCPRGNNFVDAFFTLRSMMSDKGYTDNAYLKSSTNLFNTGHMVPIDADRRKLRVNLGLDEAPPTVQSDPKTLDKVKKMLERSGFLDFVEGEEDCS